MIKKYKEYSGDFNKISSGDEVKCIKSLYKSTYKKNAFNINKKYKINRIDDMIWVVDETGKPFTFLKEKNRQDMYFFGDYFKNLIK